MTEFKPCPFCGSADIHDDDSSWFWCMDCGYGFEYGSGWKTGWVEQWNTRPIEDALRAEVEQLRSELRAYREDYRIPEGAIRLEAYEYNNEIIILGYPEDVEDDEDNLQHNCDTMGCGSMGSHVILRFSLKV